MSSKATAFRYVEVSNMLSKSAGRSTEVIKSMDSTMLSKPTCLKCSHQICHSVRIRQAEKRHKVKKEYVIVVIITVWHLSRQPGSSASVPEADLKLAASFPLSFTRR